MEEKKFVQIMQNLREVKREKTELRLLYPLLVHDVDGPIYSHLKEQLHICEKDGRSMLPPLGNEGYVAASRKKYLSR